MTNTNLQQNRHISDEWLYKECTYLFIDWMSQYGEQLDLPLQGNGQAISKKIEYEYYI